MEKCYIHDSPGLDNDRCQIWYVWKKHANIERIAPRRHWQSVEWAPRDSKSTYFTSKLLPRELFLEGVHCIRALNRKNLIYTACQKQPQNSYFNLWFCICLAEATHGSFCLFLDTSDGADLQEQRFKVSLERPGFRVLGMHTPIDRTLIDSHFLQGNYANMWFFLVFAAVFAARPLIRVCTSI